MIDFASLLQNPIVVNLGSFVLGWLTLAKPAFVTDIWAKVLGIAGTVQKAEDIIAMIDSMLKVHGIIPADAPVPSVATVKGVMTGHISVDNGKAVLAAMRPQHVSVPVKVAAKPKAKVSKAKAHTLSAARSKR